MDLAVAEISGNDHPISRNLNYYCYILKVYGNTLENFIIVGKERKLSLRGFEFKDFSLFVCVAR